MVSFRFFPTILGYSQSFVWQFVHQAFYIGRFPVEINSTLIILIPKQEVPELISQFLPISLCNIVVKIITKIIANRLKPLMN